MQRLQRLPKTATHVVPPANPAPFLGKQVVQPVAWSFGRRPSCLGRCAACSSSTKKSAAPSIPGQGLGWIVLQARVVPALLVPQHGVVGEVNIRGGAVEAACAVGGTMSGVARQKQAAVTHGLATKERSGAMDFSIDGHAMIRRWAIGAGRRRLSSSQNLSSGQSSSVGQRHFWM